MMMKRFPEINRARGYYLYTSDGKRYLDMALDGGRLIMGHRQKGYAQAMKNAIDKGILPDYPSKYAYRLKQAIKALLGRECYVYLFKSQEQAGKGNNWSSYDLIRLTQKNDLLNDPIKLILPIPADFAPGVVVSATELSLPEEPVSPVLLAGAVRAVCNLEAFLAEADYSGWEKAGLAEACAGKWKVDLPYIYPLCTTDKYGALWDAFLEAGVILSPDYDKPSVLPPPQALSDGSRKKVTELLTGC